MDDLQHTPECFASHLGHWMMEPLRLQQAVSLIKSGNHKTVDIQARKGRDARDLYDVTAQGVAVIRIDGPTAKFDSKWGGTNTVRTRRALRDAIDNSEVGSIFLHVDSPGGHVAGTQELADDVRLANSIKPVHAHADDLMASAAYWSSVNATRISANRTAEVGSIGTVAIVYDYSEKMETDGIKVHVASTGDYKGAFAHGAEVPKRHIEYLQARVDDLNGHFLLAVSQGRGLTGKALDAVSDGRVWGAKEAQALGLIDAVESMDDAVDAASVAAQKHLAQRRRSRMRAAERKTRV